MLKSQSYGNTINYADIHSSTNGLCADSSDISRSTLKMENSIIHNTTNHALNLRMANVFVGNSQITNAGGDCVHVRGGDVSLVHCTVGRFYVFTGGYGHALDLQTLMAMSACRCTTCMWPTASLPATKMMRL